MAAMIDETALYHRIQHDFPLEPRPYRRAAEALGLSEHTVLSILARDLGSGRVSRIGAVFAPNAIGAGTLAALSIPPARLERVARRLNADPAVSHHYGRTGHRYNLWFAVGARDRTTLEAVLARIAYDIDQAPLDLPLEREYYSDLGLPPDLRPPAPARTQPPIPLRPLMTDADWRLVMALEAGLPLTPEPYHALARRCGMPPHDIWRRLAHWRSCGVIRRFGAILRHRHLGYLYGAMCVWNVPDARVDAIGTRLAHLPAVSQCARRPRHGQEWPFNLFAMVRARSPAELQARLEHFTVEAGLARAPGAVLRTNRCFKQRGIRYGGAPDGQ